MDSSTIISLEVVGVKYQSRFVTHGYLFQPNQPVRDLSNFPTTASSSESVGGLSGRHVPKCMQECDFRHVVRLKSRVFFSSSSSSCHASRPHSLLNTPYGLRTLRQKWLVKSRHSGHRQQSQPAHSAVKQERHHAVMKAKSRRDAVTQRKRKTKKTSLSLSVSARNRPMTEHEVGPVILLRSRPRTPR